MKHTATTFLFISALVLLASGALAQDTDPVTNPGGGFGPGDGTGICQFVDEDGDGFNDLAPDHDGDGIPNGLDPDYVRPEDGTGHQYKYSYAFQHGLMVDVFGRGFGMIALEGPEGGHMFGLRDGTGTGFGPADGTGFGPGSGTSPGDGVGGGQGQNASGGNGNGQSGQGGRR